MTSVAPPPPSGERQVYLVSAQGPGLHELALVVRGAGYEAKTFTDSSQAVKDVFVRKPHMVVTELTGPNVEGSQLCAEVRKRLGADSPYMLVVGDGTPELRALLRDQYGAALIATAHLARLFMPTLKLIDAWEQAPKSAPSDKPLQVYKLVLPGVVEWLREYNENLMNNGAFVEVPMSPSADTLVQVRLRLPYLEFDMPVLARVLKRNRSDTTRRGFAAELQGFTTAQREALGEYLHALRQLEDKLGEVRTRLEKQPGDWFVLVDPHKRMINEEMGFLQRTGMALALMEDLDAAEEFAMSNTVVWVGINEEVLGGDGMQKGVASLERLAAHAPEVVLLRSSTVPKQLVTAPIAGGKVYTTTAAEVSARFSKRYQVQLRRSPRVACTVPVKVHLKRASVDAEAIDLSATGIQVKSTSLLALGATVRLEFSLPDAPALSCQGIVVRSRTAQGMCVVGVAFFEYAGTARNKIRDFVLAAMKFTA